MAEAIDTGEAEEREAREAEAREAIGKIRAIGDWKYIGKIVARENVTFPDTVNYHSRSPNEVARCGKNSFFSCGTCANGVLAS